MSSKHLECKIEILLLLLAGLKLQVRNSDIWFFRFVLSRSCPEAQHTPIKKFATKWPDCWLKSLHLMSLITTYTKRRRLLKVTTKGGVSAMVSHQPKTSSSRYYPSWPSTSTTQVWALTHLFLFAYCKNIDSPGEQINDPSLLPAGPAYP